MKSDQECLDKSLVQSCVFVVSVPSIVVHKGSSRSHSRPESPTVVVRGGMPSLPSSRQGFVISGSNTSYQNSPESDMIDGNANPNVGSSPTSNSHHRSSPSCPPDKSDTENKNFRTRVRVWQWDVSRFPVSNSCYQGMRVNPLYSADTQKFHTNAYVVSMWQQFLTMLKKS